jgi:hypothetical protein
MAPPIVVEDTSPPQDTPPPELPKPDHCSEMREARSALQSQLEGASKEREEWFAAHCKRQIPKEVDFRLSDGKRFERVSPEGVFWVCDNGQITNTERTPKELDLVLKIKTYSVELNVKCKNEN